MKNKIISALILALLAIAIPAKAVAPNTQYFAWTDWNHESGQVNQSPTFTFITFEDDLGNYVGQIQYEGWDVHRISVVFPAAGTYKAWITVTEDWGTVPIVADHFAGYFDVPASGVSSSSPPVILRYDYNENFTGPGWIPISYTTAQWLGYEYQLDFESVYKGVGTNPHYIHYGTTNYSQWVNLPSTTVNKWRGVRIPDSTDKSYSFNIPFPHEL